MAELPNTIDWMIGFFGNMTSSSQKMMDEIKKLTEIFYSLSDYNDGDVYDVIDKMQEIKEKYVNFESLDSIISKDSFYKLKYINFSIRSISKNIRYDKKCICNNASTKKCAKCFDTKYCSSACQKKDWKKHKQECIDHQIINIDKLLSEAQKLKSKTISGDVSKNKIDIFNIIKLAEYYIDLFTKYKKHKIDISDIIIELSNHNNFLYHFKGTSWNKNKYIFNFYEYLVSIKKPTYEKININRKYFVKICNSDNFISYNFDGTIYHSDIITYEYMKKRDNTYIEFDFFDYHIFSKIT
jgi:hypothetical protein